MNPNSDQPSELSQTDEVLLSHLSRVAKEVEPDPTFTAKLGTELMQAHQPLSRNASQPNFLIKGVSRRITLAVYASLAIAAVLGVTAITSRWLPEWAVSAFTAAVNPQANAQTTAQLVETGQVIVRSDAQEFNEETQEVRAFGNAAFFYSDAGIEATADEIRYVPTDRQIVLSGNVQILQRGELLQGTEAVCSIEQRQCRLSQN